MGTPRLFRAIVGILTALALVVPAAAGAQIPADAGPPADYTQLDGLSAPTYEVAETEVVRLPMRDGVELYMELTRPVTDEPVPVIFEASPYHGVNADRIGTRIFPDPVDEDGNMIGLVGYFAPRGYAVAMMNLRGTGRSQGCLDHMGQKDAQDLKEAIEWLADQEWSSGKVGMTGHSYVGSTPKIAAAQNPRGLVTIAPSAGIARFYDHQFQHGVAYNGQYLGAPAAYNLIAIQRHLPGGDNFGNDMQYFGCGVTTTSLQDGHRQYTGEWSAFHAQRDHTAGATAWDGPVFMIQGLHDRAVRPNGMDWFNERRRVGDKTWYGQYDHGSGVHPNRRFAQWQYALHAWFDKHLQGRDVDTGPAVEIFINDEASRSDAIPAHHEVLTADVWPPPASTMTLYADAEEGALAAANPAEGSVTFTSVQGNRGTATFTTGPVTDELVLAGIPELELQGSFTAQHLDLIVNLYDEFPGGNRRLVSQFAMNPALRNSLATAEPLVPGERYRLRPPGWPLAHKLRAGHALVMEVRTTDSDKMAMKPDDPQVTVFTGGTFGTVLRLPVLDDAVIHRDVLAGGG